jgi:hypothetical protein
MDSVEGSAQIGEISSLIPGIWYAREKIEEISSFIHAEPPIASAFTTK